MATILNDAAYMALPMNIKRGNPIPLDTTAVWYDKTELETYAASGATAYVGQILTLYADGKCEAYMISNEAGTLVKLAQTTASGDLAHDVATLQGQVNNLISKIGTPAAGEDAATGLYKDIADVLAIANKGVADAKIAQDAANAAQSDIDALETVVGANDTTGLRKRIKDNEDAIGTLQGLDTDKSARTIAAEEVAKVVNGAPESFDTLKELSDWISTHGTDATAMNTAITKLQGIVAGIGGEGEKATVVAYVTDAIAALKIGDYAKAADLTALAARVKTLEDSPAARITAEKIAAWDAKQNAGNYVDQTAYDTKISALETADSDNAKAIAAVKATADAAVPKNAAAKSGTATKVTVDSNGLVTGLAELTKEDIPTIDQDQVSGLATALGGKQDTVTFNTAYDAATNKAATMSDVNTAKSAVVGNDDDLSGVNTVKGAKKYAEEKAGEALASAKSYADGLVGTDSAIAGRVTALEGKHAEGKTVAQEVSAGIDALKLAENYAAKSTTDEHIKNVNIHVTAAKKTEWDGAVKNVETLMGTETTTGSVKQIAKGYADGKDAAIAEAKAAGTGAQAAVDTLAGKVGTLPEDATATTVVGYVDEKIGKIPAQTDYTVTVTPSDVEDYAKRYTIKQAATGLNVNIDIPKDMVVSSGRVVTNPDTTHTGTFLELTLANANNDKVYINVSDLIEYVTSGSKTGDMVVVNVSADHKVTAIITDGTITKAKLATAVQVSLDKADTAIQQAGLNSALEGYVAKNGTDRLMTAAEGTKLEGVETGAQKNVIETVKVGGTALTVTEKAVDITAISTDLLTQGVDVLILNGGTASDD